MPKIIWQRYHVLHTGRRAYTRQKIWVTLVTKPATKRGNLRGSPSSTTTKKGKQMARWGSRYLQLPQVTCSVSFFLFLSLSLWPSLRPYLYSLCTSFDLRQVQIRTVLSAVAACRQSSFSICCPNWFVVHTCCSSTSGRRPILAIIVFC